MVRMNPTAYDRWWRARIDKEEATYINNVNILGQPMGSVIVNTLGSAQFCPVNPNLQNHLSGAGALVRKAQSISLGSVPLGTGPIPLSSAFDEISRPPSFDGDRLEKGRSIKNPYSKARPISEADTTDDTEVIRRLSLLETALAEEKHRREMAEEDLKELITTGMPQNHSGDRFPNNGLPNISRANSSCSSSGKRNSSAALNTADRMNVNRRDSANSRSSNIESSHLTRLERIEEWRGSDPGSTPSSVRNFSANKGVMGIGERRGVGPASRSDYSYTGLGGRNSVNGGSSFRAGSEKGISAGTGRAGSERSYRSHASQAGSRGGVAFGGSDIWPKTEIKGSDNISNNKNFDNANIGRVKGSGGGTVTFRPEEASTTKKALKVKVGPTYGH